MWIKSFQGKTNFVGVAHTRKKCNKLDHFETLHPNKNEKIVILGLNYETAFVDSGKDPAREALPTDRLFFSFLNRFGNI
jgi:hypothetical protein